MSSAYAELRRKRPELKFRLRSRASIVVRAWRDFGSPGGPRLLDMGAADGRTMVEFARRLDEGDFTGIELDKGLIAAAPKFPDRIRLMHGDVCALPASLQEGSFDIVSMLALLEHLPCPSLALTDANRMLRDGGILVATCPHPVWDAVAGWLGWVHTEHHVQQIGLSQLVALATQAGFEVAEARRFMWAPVACLPYLYVPVSVEAAESIDRMVDRKPLLNLLCVNAFIIARKRSS